MGFQVIVTSCAPKRLRGLLTRYFLEVSPTVYVGSLPRRLLDQVWGTIVQETFPIGGWAILVERTKSAQGFSIRESGTGDANIVDVDGMWALNKTRRAH